MSYERAAELFKQSSNGGHRVGQLLLATCHEEGTGVTQDYQEARRLYALASAQGDADATEALTRLKEKIRTECPLLGKLVAIFGTSREDLNGRTGVAASFDHARGRYVVKLDGKGTGKRGPEKLKVRPENLRGMGERRGKN